MKCSAASIGSRVILTVVTVAVVGTAGWLGCGDECDCDCPNGQPPTGEDGGLLDAAEEDGGPDSSHDGGADADVPTGGSTIADIGPEVSVGSMTGYRSIGIATDSLDEPHVMAEKDSDGLYAYHHVGGAWQSAEPHFNPPGAVGSAHIEIDAQDRAWISFTTFLSGNADETGEWVMMFGDLTTAPAERWKENIRPYTGFSGNLSIDPHFPDNAWRMGGQPAPTVRFDAAGNYAFDVTMSPGASGEGIRFRIGPNQGGQEPGVWHAATGIWADVNDGGYQNSLRAGQGEGPVPWLSKTYPMSGDSFYPSVGIDGERPEVAYLAGAYQGLLINVWTGDGMMFPIDAAHQIAPDIAQYGTGVGRFTPIWTAAAGGGAFICWTSADFRIKLAYVSPEGPSAFGVPVDVGPGSKCAIDTDSMGAIHLVYDNGGVRYRKIETE